ncbi:hypothetical protein [Phycobacter sp. K97]|uniref:hypothetical protein n=1 Tax=Phycobacter sedimenti TaxID=3133977 RepID=UPI00311FFA46
MDTTMRIFPALAATFLALSPLAATGVSAATYKSGNWAAAKVGQTCYVFTQRAARDTSGALVFSFGPGGYNSGFAYEYAPWPGEDGAPWDQDDTVILEVDGQEIWLGDEMLAAEGLHGYRADMTDGFVPEMIAALRASQSTVSVNFDRAAHGEVWLYGSFATEGFSASLSEAGAMCGFDPSNLPAS